MIETLVAMTIILISLVFCGMIFINILNSGHSQEVFKAHAMLNAIAIKTKSENKFIDEYTEDGNIVIQKTIRSYNGVEDLYIQTFTASDMDGKVLARFQELIFIPKP